MEALRSVLMMIQGVFSGPGLTHLNKFVQKQENQNRTIYGIHTKVKVAKNENLKGISDMYLRNDLTDYEKMATIILMAFHLSALLFYIFKVLLKFSTFRKKKKKISGIRISLSHKFIIPMIPLLILLRMVVYSDSLSLFFSSAADYHWLGIMPYIFLSQLNFVTLSQISVLFSNLW